MHPQALGKNIILRLSDDSVPDDDAVAFDEEDKDDPGYEDKTLKGTVVSIGKKAKTDLRLGDVVFVPECSGYVIDGGDHTFYSIMKHAALALGEPEEECT